MKEEKSPKICFLTLAYPSKTNPSHGIFIQKQAHALAQLGFKLVIVAPHTYRADPKFSFENNITIFRFSYLSRDKRFSDYRKPPPFSLLTFFFSGLWKTFKTIKKENCQLIHAHWVIPTGVIGLIVAKLARLPLFTTSHGSDILVYPKKSKLSYWLAQLVLKNSEWVIAVSESLKKEIIKEFKVPVSKIKVIPPGIDHEFFLPISKSRARKKLNLPFNKKIILFTGALNPIKGFEVLKKALPEILKSYPQTLLLVLGQIQAQELKEARKILKKEKLEKQVKFTGPRSHFEMPFWINASDLVTVPSLKEGFGLIVLEALSCQVPVVASKVGEIPKIIREIGGGLLFEPGNFSELTKAILKSLKKPPSIKSPSKLKYYSLREAAKRLAQLYLRL